MATILTSDNHLYGIPYVTKSAFLEITHDGTEAEEVMHQLNLIPPLKRPNDKTGIHAHICEKNIWIEIIWHHYETYGTEGGDSRMTQVKLTKQEWKKIDAYFYDPE